jgi:hypothetical protein
MPSGILVALGLPHATRVMPARRGRYLLGERLNDSSHGTRREVYQLARQVNAHR